MIKRNRKVVPMQPVTVIAAVRTGAMPLDYRSVLGALIFSAFGMETSTTDAEIEYAAMLKGYNTTNYHDGSSLGALGKILGIGESKLFNPTTALSAIKAAIATLLATGPPKCKRQRIGDKSPEDVYQTMLARFNNNQNNPAAMKNFVEAAINLIKCLKGDNLPKGPTPF